MTTPPLRSLRPGRHPRPEWVQAEFERALEANRGRYRRPPTTDHQNDERNEERKTA